VLSCRPWGVRIRRILRSRLPERFSGNVAAMLVELAVGVSVALLFVALRLTLVPLTGDRAPFALAFVAVVAAAVLAGWRSGLVALLIGQILTWYTVVEPSWSFTTVDSAQIFGLLLATTAELLILLIITLYQREIDRAAVERDAQLHFLDRALKEIDHRTSNNYQTVLALVLAQARSAKDSSVKQALQQVADRIRAIANASRKLAVASESLEQVRIAEHLQDLCDEIQRGLARPGVLVECDYDDMVLNADTTVCVSVLVNELVTNALKHAFPDDRTGTIRVSLCRKPSGLELKVEDDGIGMKASGRSRGTGLGTRLIDTFTKQLKARHEVASDGGGTRHLVRIPG